MVCVIATVAQPLLFTLLISVDGHDLSQCPLIERKAALKRILPKSNTERIRYTEHVERIGERLFKELESLKLEGMVCKRKDSVYAFARSRLWLKVKTSAGRAEMHRRIEGGALAHDNEILSAEILFSDEDILAEFISQCELAADTHDLTKVALNRLWQLSLLPSFRFGGVKGM